VTVPNTRIPLTLACCLLPAAWLHVDDFSLRCIDPRLLSNSRPIDDTPIEAPRAFTIDTHPNLGIFAPPTSAPVAAAHRDSDYTAVTSTSRQLPPPLSEAPARRARPIASRGRNGHARTQHLSPCHKKRGAKTLESLAQQPFYHSLPTADWEYFQQVVAKLSNAVYLAAPQSLEPTVGSLDGRLLIGPRRLIGPGVAAARESVYAVLVDRSSMYAGYVGRREQIGGSLVYSTIFVVISITARTTVWRSILISVPSQLLRYP